MRKRFKQMQSCQANDGADQSEEEDVEDEFDSQEEAEAEEDEEMIRLNLVEEQLRRKTEESKVSQL